MDLAFGFTGRCTDPTTGFTHHLNRWFDSAIGKWLSNDPIGFGGGDANVQRYVVNNPLQFVDNNGLDKSPPCGGGGGGGGDVMGVSGINQRADQGATTQGKKKRDEGITYGVGWEFHGNVIAGFDLSGQLTYSPDSMEVGIIGGLYGTIVVVDPAIGTGPVFSITDTPFIEEVNGLGGMVTGSIGLPQPGLGPNLGVQASNLQSNSVLPLPIKNLTGESPTTLQIEPGVEAGICPVGGGFGYGPTGAISVPITTVIETGIKVVNSMWPPLVFPRH